MRQLRWTTILVLACACSGSTGSTSTGDTTGSDTTGSDTAASDATVGDTAGGDTSGGPDTVVADTAEPADTAPSDSTGGSDATDGGGDFGFDIRVPPTHTAQCPANEMAPNGETLSDDGPDFICTFDYASTHGHLYVQSALIGCDAVGYFTPIYAAEAAWISIDGEVLPLDKPVYDIGGNHHNDYIEFTLKGQRYKLYHSSIGFGFRACQPIDCVQVLGSGTTVVEDGCTKDRTIPVVCREVQPDKTFGSLEDTFKPCLGDPNYP